MIEKCDDCGIEVSGMDKVVISSTRGNKVIRVVCHSCADAGIAEEERLLREEE